MSEAPRVAVDARMARSSGIGTYIRAVVPRVFDGNDWRCSLLGSLDDLRVLTENGLEGTFLHDCTAPIYTVREQVELKRCMPAGADLFWSPHYNIPLLHGGRLLVTIHDTLHLALPKYVRGAHRRLFARTMFASVRRRASRIICNSQFTADELKRLVGVSSRLIEVIHMGVDERWFAAGGDTPHHRPYFLFVGNVKPHKNLGRLLAAFESILPDLPHDLIVVGRKDGFISGDVEAEAGARRLGGRCHFTGELADEEVRRYVANAEALVLPSLYEGFGLPALEAMAAGCPVLVSRAGSLPEVCGEAALYFDPGSIDDIARQLRYVVANQSARSELVCAGRERARSFTWDRCARRTSDVIASVLDAD